MQKWTSEVRVGLIAGLCAGAVVLVAPRLALRPALPRTSAASEAWTPPLTDPIQMARAALARGDSAFVGILSGDTVRLPGLSPAVSAAAATEPVRLYSRRSTGLDGSRWAPFVQDAMPYAAAYNAVVHVARTSARTRS